MTALIIMLVILVAGSLGLWRLGMKLPVAAVFIFMLEIVVNVIGYHFFGWWGGP
jgi:hypothetical protein